MRSTKRLEQFFRKFVSETPNWAIAGMLLITGLFGWFLKHSSYVRHLGGLVVAAILVNAFYDSDMITKKTSKTRTQLLLIWSAAAGLVASAIFQDWITDLVGEITVIQIFGIIVLVSRLGVNITRFDDHRNSAVILDGSVDTRAMYVSGLTAILFPELLQYLWLGQDYFWMPWLSLAASCLSFGLVYMRSKRSQIGQ